MRIQLSEHFTYKKLLRFVAPSVVMMIFTSIYCVVDGFFVSNFAGEDGFAGVNLIYPIIMCISAFGFMIGSGGSALVSKTFGEGKHELANRYFSMLIYATVIIGVLLSAIGIVFIDYIIIFLKASDNIIPHVKNYGAIMMIGLTAFMLQNVFQSFFVTAEKPKLGLYFMIGAGVTNMVLDALFVAVFKWGVKGAATATIISQAVGGFLPLIYFLSKNSSLLRLGKSAFYPKALLKTCTNGASELMINISMSVVNILYNFQLMKFLGNDGIVAYGFIMYVSFIFAAIYIGYTMGVAPLVGYNYGAKNNYELKNLFSKSVKLIAFSGGIMFLLSQILSAPLTNLYIGNNASLNSLSLHAFRIFAISFLVFGVNIFGSGFFTALNNGFVSALISFLRTLLFQVLAVTILPIFFKENGIWFSVVVAEILSIIVTLICFAIYKKKYNY